MKKAFTVLAIITVLLTGLMIQVPSHSAFAMSSSTNSCDAGNYPAPYTGGAGVAKYFHLADGSTVTITTTGAVIKQSPCQTAYREGWVSVSDICDITSSQDLTGRLRAGSSNPYGSGSFTSCTTQTTTKAASPAQPTQTQTQSVTINNPQPAVKAATTTATTQNASATKTLPNTGPGNVLMLSGATSAIGTIGHWYYNRRNRR